MRTLADLYFSKWLRTLERFNFADLKFLGFRLHICNLKNFGFHHLIKKILTESGYMSIAAIHNSAKVQVA